MKESELEKLITKTVKDLGGRSYKWVSPGNDGVPDRILCFRGGLYFMCEIKTESGKPSPIQEVQINKLLAMRQNVCICYGVKGFIELLNIASVQTYDPAIVTIKEQLEHRYSGEKDYNKGKLLMNQTLQEYLDRRNRACASS